MKLENRTQLTLLREQCQEKRNKETCKILVCGGTGCLAGGSDKIFDRFSELTAGMDHVEVRIGAEIAHGEHVGVKKSGCHGFCEMGPLVRIEPYNYLYLKVKLEDCEEIFEKTVLHGEPVTRLMYKQDNEVYQTQEEIPFYAKQTRLVLKNCGHIDAEHIEDALAVGAYEAFEKAVFEMTPEAVIKTITQSNLRGRGGAGFQTGRKWSQVAGQKEKIRYVVCLFDCNAKSADCQRVFRTDINISFLCLYRIGCDHHTFDHAMRISFHDASVHECSRISFITIADDITDLFFLSGNLGPFSSSLETSASTSTQI